MPALKHAQPVQIERDGKGGGELYWHSGAGSGAKRHPVACLSFKLLQGWIWKGEAKWSERKQKWWREGLEAFCLRQRPLRLSKRQKKKKKALCQHTSKTRRHLNKFSQVGCLGPEHDEAWCQRESLAELMHNEQVPAETAGTNSTDVLKTAWSCDLMAIGYWPEPDLPIQPHKKNTSVLTTTF